MEQNAGKKKSSLTIHAPIPPPSYPPLSYPQSSITHCDITTQNGKQFSFLRPFLLRKWVLRFHTFFLLGKTKCLNKFPQTFRICFVKLKPCLLFIFQASVQRFYHRLSDVLPSDSCCTWAFMRQPKRNEPKLKSSLTVHAHIKTNYQPMCQ